ncbi:MAG: aspartyl protease family protein [Smithellaceae bacterium]|nr:aspartyl protease family protein [Smithellaceae bacterium]
MKTTPLAGRIIREDDTGSRTARLGKRFPSGRPDEGEALQRRTGPWPVFLAACLLVLSAVSLAAAAQYYHWTDEHGVTHVSNQPPEGSLAGRGLNTVTITEDKPAPDAGRETAGANGEYVVPFRKLHGGMVVDATINDTIPVRLLVDTGSSTTVINVRLLDRFSVPPPMLPMKGKAITAAGAVEVNIIMIDKIDVGGAVKRNVPAIYSDEKYDLEGYDGLLGMSFLSDFLFTIDSEKNVLHLKRRQPE